MLIQHQSELQSLLLSTHRQTNRTFFHSLLEKTLTFWNLRNAPSPNFLLPVYLMWTKGLLDLSQPCPSCGLCANNASADRCGKRSKPARSNTQAKKGIQAILLVLPNVKAGNVARRAATGNAWIHCFNDTPNGSINTSPIQCDWCESNNSSAQFHFRYPCRNSHHRRSLMPYTKKSKIRSPNASSMKTSRFLSTMLHRPNYQHAAWHSLCCPRTSPRHLVWRNPMKTSMLTSTQTNSVDDTFWSK